MTNTAVPIETHIANGTTTKFSYLFTIFDAASLKVYVDDVLQLLNQTYTIVSMGENGGDIEFKTAPTSGQEIRLVRETELKRTIKYTDNGDLLAQTLNEDFDRLWLIQQENKAANLSVLGRSTPTGPWEAKHAKIEQVADGTLASDAATVGQLNSIGGGVAANAQAALNAAQSATQQAAAALASQQAAQTAEGNAFKSLSDATAQAQLAEGYSTSAAAAAGRSGTSATASEASRVAAETAQSKAEAAQAKSETAQSKAEAAQAKAELAATNANAGIDLTLYPTKTEVAADLAKKADKTAIPDLTPYAIKSDVTAELAKKADASAIPDVSNFRTSSQVNTAVNDGIDAWSKNSPKVKQPFSVLDNTMDQSKGLEVSVTANGVGLRNREDASSDGLVLGTNGKLTFHGDELAFAKDVPAAGSGSASTVADGATIRNATLISPTFRFTAGQPIKLENSQGGLQITRNPTAAYVGISNIAAAQAHGNQYANELRFTDAGGVQFVNANGVATDLLKGGGGAVPANATIDSPTILSDSLEIRRKTQVNSSTKGLTITQNNTGDVVLENEMAQGPGTAAQLYITGASGLKFYDGQEIHDLLKAGGVTSDGSGDYAIAVESSKKLVVGAHGLGVSLSNVDSGGVNTARIGNVNSGAYMGLKGDGASSSLVFSPDGSTNSEATIWPPAPAGLDIAAKTPGGEAVSVKGSFTDTGTFQIDMYLGATQKHKWQLAISLMGAITLETWDSSGVSRGKKSVTLA